MFAGLVFLVYSGISLDSKDIDLIIFNILIAYTKIKLSSYVIINNLLHCFSLYTFIGILSL